MTKIELLEKETDEIRIWLEELKNNVSIPENEKKDKAEELKIQAETTKQKIENEIKTLETATDTESKKEKEKAETLLKSFIDITNLYNSILNPSIIPASTPTQTKSEDKNVFVKTKDWIWEQWDSMRDWKKRTRSSEWWKNALRTAWFLATWVWAVAITYKWLKNLLKRAFSEDKEDEEKETETKSKKKKKSFWDRRYWKALKWTGIAVWGWTLINWIWEYFWWWGQEWATVRDLDKKKYNSYKKFKENPDNKEKVERYEKFGDNIDILYEEIYNRELQAWYQDPLGMERISKKESGEVIMDKWIIPYCLDNQFKTVENILGQNSSLTTALYNGLDGMINFIKDKWWDFLKIFSESFLSILPSWIPFKNMTWSISERIDKRKIQNEHAEQEMQYFFRQSIRVQTYLFEKKSQLANKIAKDASNVYWISEDDILKDKDKFDKYVARNADYQNFLNSPIYSSSIVLEKYNISDAQIDKEFKDAIWDLNIKRDEILKTQNWKKDILEVIYEKKNKWEQLNESDNAELQKACDGIIKATDEEIMSAVEESGRNIYGDLFRTNNANLREYLDKSWLDKLFLSFKKTISDKKQDLIAWRLSNKEKFDLARVINDMLALKKEAEMWRDILEKDYDEYWNIIRRIPWFLKWSVENLCKWMGDLIHWERLEWTSYLFSAWLWTWLIITSAWVVKGIKTGKWWVAKVWAVIMTLPVSVPIWLPSYGAYKVAMHNKNVRRAINIYNPMKYMWERWAKNLLKHLKDGQIPLADAWIIIERKALGVWTTKETEEAWKKIFWVTDDMKNVNFKAIAFDALVKEVWWTAWATQLQQIKKDGKLYEELVEGFDNSQELRQAIKRNASIEELKRLAFEANIPEYIKNNFHLRLLLSDIENAEAAIKLGWWTQEQIEKQLKKLMSFRDEIIKLDVKNLEQTAELIWVFKWNKSFEFAIEQLSIFKKLEGKKITSKLLDNKWNPIETSLDEILESFDFEKLRLYKDKIKELWLSDESIEWLAKAFEIIKARKIQKLFNNNMWDIFKTVKNLVKILAKTS